MISQKPIKKEKDQDQSRMGEVKIEKTAQADAMPSRIRHKGESKEIIKAVKDR